jgi:hypothetical protein
MGTVSGRPCVHSRSGLGDTLADLGFWPRCENRRKVGRVIPGNVPVTGPDAPQLAAASTEWHHHQVSWTPGDPRRDEARHDEPRHADRPRPEAGRVEGGRTGTGGESERREGGRPIGTSIFDQPVGDQGGLDDVSEVADAGRRRRNRGAPRFERSVDPDVLADRDEIVRVPVAPTGRLLSVAVAVFAGLLGVALIAGGYLVPRSFALIVFAAQLLFVLVWTVATRPAGPRVVAGVGLAAAIVADLAVAWPTHATIAPLGYVTAGAFIAGMIAQLARRDGRLQVAESVGATLTMVVGVVAYASLITLSRNKLGPESIAACLAAATVALVVARGLDAIVPFPRTTPQVARGTIGIIVGAMAGTVASAFVASALVGLSPGRTVYAGLLTAIAAVLADLGVGYAEASREIDGEVSSLWLVRHMQGPLGAFALAAPVAYAMSVMVLLPALS